MHKPWELGPLKSSGSLKPAGSLSLCPTFSSFTFCSLWSWRTCCTPCTWWTVSLEMKNRSFSDNRNLFCYSKNILISSDLKQIHKCVQLKTYNQCSSVFVHFSFWAAKKLIFFEVYFFGFVIIIVLSSSTAYSNRSKYFFLAMLEIAYS